MPKFQLSTILGAAVSICVALQHAFPDQPWIGLLAAGLTAIGMDEKDLAKV